MKMARVGPTLVTGATGFVGSAVARALGHAATRSACWCAPPPTGATWTASRRRSCSATSTIRPRWRARWRAVAMSIHLAADYRIWVPKPEQMLKTNVDGTANVMRAAKAAGVERIVHCSSVAALAVSTDGTPTDEDTPVDRGQDRRVLQAVEIPRRAGGPRADPRAGPAGGDRESGRAGRHARHQADADRADDRGRRQRQDPGLHGHRAEPGAGRRRGDRPCAGAGARAHRPGLHPGR